MKYRLKSINETTISGVLNKHAKAGYIIITAFRGGDQDENVLKQNLINNKKLKSYINQSGYSHTIVWGGFKEEETGQIVREQSFMIFNYKRKAEKQEDIKYLKKFGYVMCKKFNQDAFFCKEPDDGQGQYIDASGKITMKFNGISPTKAADIYFTTLEKSRKKSNLKKSFTFEHKLYVPKGPQSLYEAYQRDGEIFFKP